ncbi:MAG: Ig-like domain-containing protein [Planctomycetota bacterium]
MWFPRSRRSIFQRVVAAIGQYWIQSRRERWLAQVRQRRTRRSIDHRGQLVHVIERLEPRTLLSAISWDGGAGNLSWNSALNWSGDVLPTTADDVSINPVGITVTLVGAASVHSLQSNANLTLSSGALTVGASSALNGNLTLTSSSVTVDGASAQLFANGTTTVNSSNLFALNGGQLSLLGPASHNAFSVATTIRASGAGSSIDLSGMTSFNGSLSSTSGVTNYTSIQSLAGGHVQFGNTQTLTGQTNISADGAGSLVDLSGVLTLDGGVGTTFNRIDPFKVTVQNSGAIQTPNVTTLKSVSLYAFNGLTLDLHTATSYTALGADGLGRFVTIQANGSGSQVNLSGLTSFRGSFDASTALGTHYVFVQAVAGGAVDLSGVVTLTGQTNISADGSGSIVNLTAAQTLNGGTGTKFDRSEPFKLTVRNGGTIQTPNLHSLNSVSLYAFNGLTLDLHTVTSYTGVGADGAGRYAIIQANGTGSRIDLSGVTSYVGSFDASTALGTHYVFVQAMAGGTVDLSGVVTLTGQTNISADGAGSIVNLAAAQTLNGGAATKFDRAEPFKLIVRNGGTIQTPNVRTLNSVSLYAFNGLTLDLHLVTSYSGMGADGIGRYAIIQANGTGSRIDLSGVTSYVGSFSASTALGTHYVFVQAVAGGTVDLSGVVTLTGQTDISADGAGSVVNLAAAQSLDGGAATKFDRAEPFKLAVRNGGTIQTPNLHSLNSVSLYAFNGLTLDLHTVTSYTGVGADGAGRYAIIQANGTGSRVDLSGVTSYVGSFDASTALGTHYVFVQAIAGGTVDLSGVVTLTGQTNISADGAGSIVNLTAAQTLNGGTGTKFDRSEPFKLTVRNGGTIQTPNLHSLNSVSLYAFNGLTLDLHTVTSYTGVGTDGVGRYAIIQANGTGSRVNLSGVTSFAGSRDASTALGTHYVFVQAVSGGVVDLTGAVTISQRTSMLVTGGQIALATGVVDFTGTSIITVSSGSLTAGTLRVATGADVTAVGTLTTNVENRGLLRPGNTLGTLGIVGNLTQTTTGTLFVQLGGTTPGTQYDRVAVTGSVAVAGTLNVSFVSGFVPALGSTFLLIDNDAVDAVSGTFAGLAQGATITVSGQHLRASYIGGDGNDVALTVVSSPNVPPVAAANVAAVSANEGGTATNAGTFSDAQGNATVTISASIGVVTQNNAAGTWNWSLNAADGPAGPFTVTITATDTSGAAANATFTYSVNNVVPTISLSGNATVHEGSPYTLNLGVVTDPGTDTITSYKINWGDGVIDNFTGNPANTTATHTFADGPGTQTNNVTVTDEDGNFLVGSLSVQVLDVAPTIALTGNSNVNEGSAFTLNLGARTDPGSDTVSAYSINWGDGNIENFTGNPANTTRTHTYADGPSNYIISVSLTDEDGTFTGGTRAVTIDNVAPTVAGGPFSLDENSVNGTVVGSASATDPGADTFSFSITGGNVSGAFAIHATTGQITVANSAAIVYGTTPVFTLTVAATDSDGAVGIASVTINLNSVNAAPVGANDTFTTNEDTVLSVTAASLVTSFGPLTPTDTQVSTTTSVGEMADVAFDGTRYLMVWAQQQGSLFQDIYGQFVTTSGTLSGSPFVIASHPNNQTAPTVAFNGTHYLVAWNDNFGTDNRNSIDIRVVRTDGTLGTEMILTSPSATISNSGHDVASNGTDFLVVWGDNRNSSTNGRDIYSQRVAVNGAGTATLIGSELAVVTTTEHEFNPSVAFGDTNYLVTWTSDITVNASQFNVKGATVSPAGVISSPIDISTATGLQGNRAAGVAYGDNSFLVVFDDNRDGTGDVGGARVSNAGVLLDGPATTGGILIAANPGGGGPTRPQVAFDGQEWLVAWSSSGIRGTRVASDGTVLNPSANPSGVALTQTTSSLRWDPSLASDGTNFLVSFHDSPSPNDKYVQLVGETILTPAAGLLANDTDADGDTLTITQINGSGLLTSSSTLGAHVTVTSNGSFTYDPTVSATLQALPQGSTLNDTFTYTVTDGYATVNATVTILVAGINDVPVANASSVTTNEDTAYTFAAGVFGFTDVEGNALASITVSGLSLASGDTLTVDQGSGAVTVTNGMTITAAQIATLIYSPAANANGTARSTFNFKVNDAGLGTVAATMSVNVTAVNDVPVAQASSVTTNEDTAYTFAVPNFGFTDVEGNGLTSITISSLNLAAGDTLKLSGTDVTVNQTILAANIANLVYTPMANANGSGRSTFNFKVNDAGLGAVAATMSVNVTAINDVPVANASSVTTNEDTAYTFAATDFGFTDVEGNGLVSITISSLNLAAGDTLKLSGTDVTVNQTILAANIANLVHTPMANANGSARSTFSFRVNDADLGTAAATMSIGVTAVNDVPVANASSVTTNEDTPHTFAAGDFGFTDAEGDGLASITISALNLAGGDTLKLGGTDVTVNQTILAVDIANLVYTPAANANGSGRSTFSFKVNDAGSGTVAASLTINVTAVNDAPVANASSVMTNEDTAYTFAAGDFGFTDVEGNSLASITISSLSLASGDTLRLSGMDVTVNQTILAANIANLVYTPAANANGSGRSTFNFQVNDAGLGTVAVTMSVNVTAVNDLPVALAGSVTTNEDTPRTFVVSDFLFTDVESDGLVSITVSGLTLAVGDTLTVDQGSGAVTVTNGMTITAAQIVSLIYTPTANANGSGRSTFNFQVNDAGLGTVAATMSVNVTAVNDVPVALAGSVTTNEDTAHTFVAGDFGFTDAEGDGLASITISALNLASGDTLKLSGTDVTVNQTILAVDIANLVYAPAANANGSGRSTFNFQVNDADNGTVAAVLTIHVTAVNDVPIANAGSVTTNEDTAYTFAMSDFGFTDVEGNSLASITISSLSLASGDMLKLSGTDVTVNQTILAADLANLVYTPTANANGSGRSTFDFQVNDAGSGTVAATLTINVTAVNDVPVAQAGSVMTNEDTAYTFAVSDFLFTDIEFDSLVSITVSGLSLAGGDTLTVNQGSGAVTVTNGMTILAADLANLMYTPAANANGSDRSTFDFQVNDADSGTVAATLTINVTAVNDVPVANASSVTTNEDTAYTFAVGDFGFTDVEGNSLASITISSLSLASGDTLKLNGTDVTVNQTILAANIANLVYTPAANANGSGRSTFNFQVNDADAGTVAATLTINVNPVNEVNVAPAISNAGNIAVDEGQIASNSGTWSDVDAGDDVTLSASVGLVTQNANGTWSWSFDTNDGPAQSQTVTITADDGTTTTETTFELTVRNVAPDATSNNYTTTQATALSGNVLTDGVADSDPAGALDPLTVSAVNGVAANVGQAIATANGMLTVNANGSFTYQPATTFSGTESFTYTISDGDGGSDTATVTIVVTPTASGSILTVTDTCCDGGTALLITGTSANDTILVEPGSTNSTLKVTVNGVNHTVAKPSGRIIVTGGAGNDNIQIAGAISNSVWLYGDAGDDRLNAGNASPGGNLLFGGDGNDDLLGGNGRDIMIGGQGADKITGNANDDILVAGLTTHDSRSSAAHEEFWCRVMDEWTDTTPFETRVNKLRTGTGATGVNLMASVLDDNSIDQIDKLQGSSGDDWFIFKTGEDKVVGQTDATN